MDPRDRLESPCTLVRWRLGYPASPGHPQSVVTGWEGRMLQHLAMRSPFFSRVAILKVPPVRRVGGNGWEKFALFKNVQKGTNWSVWGLQKKLSTGWGEEGGGFSRWGSVVARSSEVRSTDTRAFLMAKGTPPGGWVGWGREGVQLSS